jgi:hypothetical protein
MNRRWEQMRRPGGTEHSDFCWTSASANQIVWRNTPSFPHWQMSHFVSCETVGVIVAARLISFCVIGVL